MRASSHMGYTLSRCILARIIALSFPEGPFSNVEASPGSILRWHRQSCGAQGSKRLYVYLNQTSRSG
jgi:hypothetical protein